MKLSPFGLYLRTMIVGPNKCCSLSKEEAQAQLVALTRQNFGFDVDQWREWAKRNPRISGMRPSSSSDPIYTIHELADSKGESLSNQDIDRIIYGE